MCEVWFSVTSNRISYSGRIICLVVLLRVRSKTTPTEKSRTTEVSRNRSIAHDATRLTLSNICPVLARSLTARRSYLTFDVIFLFDGSRTGCLVGCGHATDIKILMFFCQRYLKSSVFISIRHLAKP